MKKVGNHSSISRILLLGLVLMLNCSMVVMGQEGDPAKGKSLFNSNCAACHKLDAKSTGPALRGITEKYDSAWLHKWIRNSSDLIKSGDTRAVKVFEENGKVPMTSFPAFTDQDINDIIAYTSQPKAIISNSNSTASAETTVASGGISNEIILGALTLVMLILVIMLVLVNNVLTKIAKSNGIQIRKTEKTMPIWVAFAKNQFLVLVTVILLLLMSGYFVYGYLMQIGVDKGYSPIQPIHYSHKIHAGDNGIDCKYCHSSARVSKQSGIPSLNVCMNCHKNISEVAETTASPEYSKAFYDAEIQKLYTAVGWDREKQVYTGKEKPVKWIRIHNLPDFVYFNHSQHVIAGGIECQTCHGSVETMEIMEQHSTLTMGWCINCHRETNVKMEDNEYYKKIHEELSKKYGLDKLTVAQMGGLECGKCHY